MNYVRKLGFEETPDYDFLRELFSKVLKTLSEPEDGVFDWMLLNNGKGWEAGHVRLFTLIITSSATDIVNIDPCSDPGSGACQCCFRSTHPSPRTPISRPRSPSLTATYRCDTRFPIITSCPCSDTGPCQE